MINTKKTRALFATAALVIAGAAQAGPVYIHDINMEWGHVYSPLAPELCFRGWSWC